MEPPANARRDGCLDHETLAAYADGLLAGDAIARADRHIDVCPSCRGELSALAATHSVAAGSVTPPPGRGEPGHGLYCATCEQEFAAGELCPNDGTRLVRLASEADPLLGRDLDGRYTILEKLGEGGMGAVYRARQHSVGREVAIKLVSPALVSDPSSIRRFLREAKLASRLVHPNIVAVVDFGQTRDGLFYLVMELVGGRTLHRVLQDEGRLGTARLVRIGSQICDALEGAHALPIIHRDLKPANVMLLAQGRDLVKVLDFGLAKSLSPEHSSLTTVSGALMGTPAFMPPEVANGQPVDARADLYSLGCILYQIGSGHPPFVADSIPEMITMHGSRPAPPATGVPAPIAAVIDRLLRKRPDERYPSAAAVRSALEEAYDASRSAPAITDTVDESLEPTIDAGPDAAPSELDTPTLVAPAPPPPIASAREESARAVTAAPTPPRDRSSSGVPPEPAQPTLATPPSRRARAWIAGGFVVVIAIAVAAIASRGHRSAALGDELRAAPSPTSSPPPPPPSHDEAALVIPPPIPQDAGVAAPALDAAAERPRRPSRVKPGKPPRTPSTKHAPNPDEAPF